MSTTRKHREIDTPTPAHEWDNEAYGRKSGVFRWVLYRLRQADEMQKAGIKGPGEALKMWRLRRGLSRAEARMILKLSHTHYTNIEQGTRSPSLKTAVHIEKATRGWIPVASWMKKESGPATFVEPVPKKSRYHDDVVPYSVVTDELGR